MLSNRHLSSATTLAAISLMIVAGGLAGIAPGAFTPHRLVPVSDPFSRPDAATPFAHLATPSIRSDSVARPGVPTFTWWNITNESSTPLPVFWFTQGAWDSSDGYLMFYGGDNFAGTNLGDTWAYQSGEWTKTTTSGSPGPLDGPAMAYDPSSKQVVMYGGLQSYSPFSYTNLTWLYSGGTWTSLHLTPTPPGRLAATMAYDADLGGIVLFGGYNNSDQSGNTLLNDTWLFKAGAWSRVVTTNAPTVRTWPTLAYDPSLHKLVLFSGLSGLGQCIGDTWTLTNKNWTHVVTPPGGPSTLCASEIGYDPDFGHVLLTGGFDSAQTPNTASWIFNGTGWQTVPASGGSGIHEYGVSAWDPTINAFVVAGGSSTPSTTNLLSHPLQSAAGITGPGASEVGAPTQFSVNVSGGVPTRSYQWSWGDGTSSTGGPSSTHVFATLGTKNISVQVRDGTGSTLNATTSIHVTSGPIPTGLASRSVADVGQSVAFKGSATSGTGASTFSWDFGDGVRSAGTHPAHAYTTAGTFRVTLTATDSVAGTGSVSLTIKVDPALTVGAIVLPSAEVGVAVSWNATASGGTPPYSYLWTIDGVGPLASSHVFSTAGPHLINLTVKDAANVSVSRVATLTVAPAVDVVVSGVTTVGVGTESSWNATGSGGVAPFTFSWTLPNGAKATGASASYAFTAVGSYRITVVVSDSLGGHASAVEVVNVTAISTPSASTSGGVPTLVLVGVAAAAIVAAGALYMRKRKPGRPPDP